MDKFEKDAYESLRAKLFAMRTLNDQRKEKLKSCKGIKINGEFYTNENEVIEAYGIGYITKSQRDRALKIFNSRKSEYEIRIINEENYLILQIIYMINDKLEMNMEDNEDEI